MPYNYLDYKTFKSTVIDDKENVWIVAYMDPVCGGCKKLSEVYQTLNKKPNLSGRKIKFGYVDVSEAANNMILTSYCGTTKVQYTPTIMIYGKDKANPVEYNGDYTEPNIL